MGSGSKSDIALDDITVSSGACDGIDDSKSHYLANSLKTIHLTTLRTH